MKVQLDKYYTKSEVAKNLINTTYNILKLNKEALFLEPSAGNGSFSKQLNNVVAYDIKPEDQSIIKQDFLTLVTDKHYDVAIGNPPFGKRNALSIAFFNKCAILSDAIAFIIPITFRKWSVQSKLNANFKLVYDEVIDDNSFFVEDKDYLINCCFQIWVNKDIKRYNELPDLRLKGKPKISNPDFNLWQYNATQEAKKYLYENWDVAIYRQGYKDYNDIFTRKDYDKVKDLVLNTNIQLMFIQFNNNISKQVFDTMDLNQLARGNLSTPGFGKADFIFYYENKKKDLLSGRVI